MKTRLVALFCLAVFGLFLATTASTEAKNPGKMQKQKEKAKVTELKATKGETSRGVEADPNIKEGDDTNDPDAQMDAPPSKGGATTRGGGYCEVQFDNRTPWYIRLYVDGTYRGTLAPYGDAIVYALPGSTSVYGRANFDDGSYSSWGPSRYSCGPGQYIPFRMLR